VSTNTNQNVSPSILASVASHEQELLAQLEASKAESREIVEQARTNARTFLQESESEINDNLASIRRKKDIARTTEFEETVSSAEGRLESVRTAAGAKIDDVASEVLALFLPKTGGN
jgi:vacuolar-type H+-ATPase subunit H